MVVDMTNKAVPGSGESIRKIMGVVMLAIATEAVVVVVAVGYSGWLCATYSRVGRVFKLRKSKRFLLIR